MQPDYVQLLVRALLLDDRVAEANDVVEQWVARTGDTGARRNLQAMLQQLEEARAYQDSVRAAEPVEEPDR
jgi:hypothetical protein